MTWRPFLLKNQTDSELVNAVALSTSGPSVANDFLSSSIVAVDVAEFVLWTSNVHPS